MLPCSLFQTCIADLQRLSRGQRCTSAIKPTPFKPSEAHPYPPNGGLSIMSAASAVSFKFPRIGIGPGGKRQCCS